VLAVAPQLSPSLDEQLGGIGVTQKPALQRGLARPGRDRSPLALERAVEGLLLPGDDARPANLGLGGESADDRAEGLLAILRVRDGVGERGREPLRAERCAESSPNGERGRPDEW
jgi:hypothetical protein